MANKIKYSKVDNTNTNNNHDTEEHDFYFTINNIINVTRHNKIIVFISKLHKIKSKSDVRSFQVTLDLPNNAIQGDRHIDL